MPRSAPSGSPWPAAAERSTHPPHTSTHASRFAGPRCSSTCQCHQDAQARREAHDEKHPDEGMSWNTGNDSSRSPLPALLRGTTVQLLGDNTPFPAPAVNLHQSSQLGVLLSAHHSRNFTSKTSSSKHSTPSRHWHHNAMLHREDTQLAAGSGTSRDHFFRGFPLSRCIMRELAGGTR